MWTLDDGSAGHGVRPAPRAFRTSSPVCVLRHVHRDRGHVESVELVIGAWLINPAVTALIVDDHQPRRGAATVDRGRVEWEVEPSLTCQR